MTLLLHFHMNLSLHNLYELILDEYHLNIVHVLLSMYRQHEITPPPVHAALITVNGLCIMSYYDLH